KAVAEVRISGHDKGGAISAFLNEAPFEGRRPVFAGDDVTDEDGFAVVDRRGGISIKVGDGDSVARYRVPDVSALRDWLGVIGRMDGLNDEAAE
ncbi:MAG: trehalose-phosphatase, partial [Pseudomonadota bacterium]